MTIGVRTRRHFKVSMLEILAASSLHNSVEDLEVSLRKGLRELLYAGLSRFQP